MPRRVPDITKIRALIGYEPEVELDEILTRVIASFRSQMKLESHRTARRRERAPPAGEADPPAAAGDGPRPLAGAARDRPDRKHQHLQREVRVLPARRDAPAQGVMDLELFKKVVDECAELGHHARARAQLRRAVPRSPTGGESALREGEGHQGSRHDQQRLADHREDRARHDRGRTRRDQHQRRRRRQGSLRADAHRAQLRQGHRQHRAAGPAARRARQHAGRS